MMAEGVTVSDEDGIIQYTNAAADEMFGYDRGELLGHPTEVQNAAEADGARPLQTAGVGAEEQLNRKKDGTLFSTRARVSSLEVSGKRYRSVYMRTSRNGGGRNPNFATRMKALARLSRLLPYR